MLEIALPPNLAFGNLGHWYSVPPNAVVLFSIELHEVREASFGRIVTYLALLGVVYVLYLKLCEAFPEKKKRRKRD